MSSPDGHSRAPYRGAATLAGLIRGLQGLFPDSSLAHEEGLLCQGGELSVPLLLAAYGRGIFPWYNEGDPVLWWTPSPRCIMEPASYHMPRRSARYLRSHPFDITLDRAFGEVIRACGATRPEGTWVSKDIVRAYVDLHEAGFAHSIEAWRQGRLVGGLYGIALGRAFFGESMFHTEDMASRAAFQALARLLVRRGILLLDCQQETPHVMAQGAVLVDRRDFESRLDDALTWNPQADDALTREYAEPRRDVPASSPAKRPCLSGNPREIVPVERMWPYLPWRTSYVWEVTDWKEQAMPPVGCGEESGTRA